MCGIAGYVTADIRCIGQCVNDRLRESILYRGRDARGEWDDGAHVRLFHARLSIIDLQTGNQPMHDAGGRYVIVYNGEIYNYRELRDEYARMGAGFRTRSDTEVILEGFKLKGEKVCNDLNGMFAFAIWDKTEKQLFLARDHLGKKPLYWCSCAGVFYFASTLEAFLTIPGWKQTLSLDAIRLYQNFGSCPEDLTVYEHARMLPYASHGMIRPDETTPSIKRYWRFNFLSKSRARFDDLLDEYGELLTDAIRLRLRSDVPLAITFSGGVDSGTIAAICTRNLGVPLTCYTLDYHTADDPSEEVNIAGKVAKLLELDWKFIHYDYHKDLLKDLAQAYRYYDQPCVQMTLVYALRLYEAIKPYATVVLSGNGGDEIFTGYNGDETRRLSDIRLAWLRRRKHLLQLARFSPLAGIPYLARNFAELQALESHFMPYQPSDGDASAPEQALVKMSQEQKLCGVKWFLDQAMFSGLTCVAVDANYRIPDISGLAAQVEVRSPFLDYRLVEFAERLPHQYKIANPQSPHSNKYLPKVYYERFVPKDIAWSRKKGMGMNLRWDQSIIHDLAFRQEFSNAYHALDQAGIDSAQAREAWAQNLQGNRQFEGQMMAGFMLGMWLHSRPFGSTKGA